MEPDRVQTIVRNLKTFSHVDKNDIQRLDLNECLDGTISIIWNELKYKATVEKDYGDLPSVSGYPQQISQVFMNLLINASHAIESQGIIRIHSWAKDDFVFVSITDNGCGISDEKHAAYFRTLFHDKRGRQRDWTGFKHGLRHYQKTSGADLRSIDARCRNYLYRSTADQQRWLLNKFFG